MLRLADGAGVARDRFIERLFDAGIGCSVHYIPLHLHPYWRDRYALHAGDVSAQPAGLRAHAEPADLYAHERTATCSVWSMRCARRYDEWPFAGERLMNALTQPKLSLEAYLAWEEDQAEKHEFYRGEVFAMVGARRVHGRVVGNLER